MKAFGQDQRLKDLFLPTYSPWLNPIEKVWRRAKQIVAHAHPWCDDFAAFTQTILSHLADTSTQGEQLLKYVGLSPQ
jgi:transposase